MEIDKGAPGNLLSFCWKGKVTKKGSLIVAEEKDFVPTEDLNVLIE